MMPWAINDCHFPVCVGTVWLHKGHLLFNTSHCLRQALWKQWLQGNCPTSPLPDALLPSEVPSEVSEVTMSSWQMAHGSHGSRSFNSTCRRTPHAVSAERLASQKALRNARWTMARDGLGGLSWSQRCCAEIREIPFAQGTISCIISGIISETSKIIGSGRLSCVSGEHLICQAHVMLSLETQFQVKSYEAMQGKRGCCSEHVFVLLCNLCLWPPNLSWTRWTYFGILQHIGRTEKRRMENSGHFSSFQLFQGWGNGLFGHLAAGERRLQTAWGWWYGARRWTKLAGSLGSRTRWIAFTIFHHIDMQ